MKPLDVVAFSLLFKSVMVFLIYPLGGLTMAAFWVAIWGILDLTVGLLALQRWRGSAFFALVIAVLGLVFTYFNLQTGLAPDWLYYEIWLANLVIAVFATWHLIQAARGQEP